MKVRTLLSLLCLAPAAFAHSEDDDHHHDHAPVWLRVALEAAESRVSIVERDGKRVIESNGLPNHTPGEFPRRGNPNRISPQNHRFEVTLKPDVAPKPTPAERAWFGVAVNGVPFEAGTAEFWGPGWNYEAINGALNLGLDEHLAHVQPTGAYHYHGTPAGLLAKLGANGKKMVLLGWAADGFPIYAGHAHAEAKEASSPVRAMRSSYRLKTTTRPGEPDGPGGKPDGAFTADYEYVAGSGDLDECNGRFGVTPEFPQGTYYYCVTAEFPFVARMWRGTPDRTFMKRGGPPGGGPRGPRRGPPGLGPRPPRPI